MGRVVALPQQIPCPPEYSRQAAEEGAAEPWPAPVRTSIPVNALVPDGPFDPAGLAGFSCVKVKVGYDGDVDRVAEVRDAIGPHVALRVDANGVWDLDTAVTRLREDREVRPRVRGAAGRVARRPGPAPLARSTSRSQPTSASPRSTTCAPSPVARGPTSS